MTLSLPLPSLPRFISRILRPRFTALATLLAANAHEYRSIIRSISSGNLKLRDGTLFAIIKTFAVIGYAWGKEMDSEWTGEGVVVRSEGRAFEVRKEDEETRLARMGTFFSSGDHDLLDGPTQNNETPGVAVVVVVPVLISAESDFHQLKRLLNSLVMQTRPPNKILIVDDGSPRFSFLETHPCVEILHLKQNIGPAGARNAGIRHAISGSFKLRQGNGFVLLTDLDCIPTPTWIATGVAALTTTRDLTTSRFTSQDPILIAGTTLSTGDSIFSKYHDYYGTLNPRLSGPSHASQALKKQPLYAPTCNLLLYLGGPESKLRLPTFDEAFREPSMEDVLFCVEARWRKGCEFEMKKIAGRSARSMTGHVTKVYTWSIYEITSDLGPTELCIGVRKLDARNEEQSMAHPTHLPNGVTFDAYIRAFEHPVQFALHSAFKIGHSGGDLHLTHVALVVFRHQQSAGTNGSDFVYHGIKLFPHADFQHNFLRGFTPDDHPIRVQGETMLSQRGLNSLYGYGTAEASMSRCAAFYILSSSPVIPGQTYEIQKTCTILHPFLIQLREFPDSPPWPVDPDWQERAQEDCRLVKPPASRDEMATYQLKRLGSAGAAWLRANDVWYQRLSSERKREVDARMSKDRGIRSEVKSVKNQKKKLRKQRQKEAAKLAQTLEVGVDA
ncbi:hypothetical protein P7C70_g2852, partial [Phenoliferia sp. Uapishka_3]